MARETSPVPEGAPPRPPGWAPVNGPQVWAAGVGGGVGTTTLAGLLGVIDAGVWRWWEQPRMINLLVCSPVSSSTAAAERIIGQQLAPVGARPILVVVSDGHSIPPDSRARLTTLGPLCGAVVHVPFVAAWRTVTQPLEWAGDYPRQLASALADLRLALDTVSTAPPPAITRPSSAASARPTLPPSWRPPATDTSAAEPSASAATKNPGAGPVPITIPAQPPTALRKEVS